MSHKPVLCIQVNEEIQLRLLEEQHVEDYFAFIARIQAYLQAWIAVEAYEGSVETLRAYMKQRLLQFVTGDGYHLGIWYQEALVGISSRSTGSPTCRFLRRMRRIYRLGSTSLI